MIEIEIETEIEIELEIEIEIEIEIDGGRDREGGRKGIISQGPQKTEPGGVPPQGFSGLWKEVSGQMSWRTACYSKYRNCR